MAEFQHRWFSLLLALRSHDEIMQSRFPYRLLTLHGCSLNWEIHLLIACLLYYLEEKPFCGKKNSLCGSIHHYMTEGRGAECTMWDSILSPRQLLFTPGAFSFFVQSVAAMLLCLSSQSTAASCDFISMHLTWVTCLCRGGGRGALKLHCREAF